MEPRMNEIAHSFQRLWEAAKARDWELVDAEIASVINFHGVLWAAGRGGLGNSDPNIRDFAATILEKSPKIDYPLAPDVLEFMRDRMLNDSNKAVRLRLACAFFRRKFRDDEVLKIMDEAVRDPDVGPSAKEYRAEK